MNEQEGLNERLREAAGSGDLSGLAKALADGADAMAGQSSALSLAAAYGHEECVRRLIPVSDPLGQDSCALRAAAARGRAECVRFLMAASDVSAVDSYALRWAAAGGHADCVALLLPASDPLAVGDDGLDAAGMARARGHVEVAGMIEAFMDGVQSTFKSDPKGKVDTLSNGLRAQTRKERDECKKS
jgi:hypothetical protein